ncbi:MAG: DUF4199 domain-containing protein [Bacteroidales bacterium]|nr:DUF4199 domain-containing protein [Bacteroidales bacterium]
MNKEKSVFKSSAETGLFFGIYLVATFLSFAYSNDVPLLSFIGLALFAGVPIVMAILMYRYHIANPETNSFSSVWTFGSTTFIFGSLIWAFATYMWLEFVVPGFLVTQAKEALIIYESVPETKNLEFTKALRLAIENNDLPSPIEFTIQMLWSSLSIGIFTSLLITPLVRLFKHKKLQ